MACVATRDQVNKRGNANVTYRGTLNQWRSHQLVLALVIKKKRFF